MVFAMFINEIELVLFAVKFDELAFVCSERNPSLHTFAGKWNLYSILVVQGLEIGFIKCQKLWLNALLSHLKLKLNFGGLKMSGLR